MPASSPPPGLLPRYRGPADWFGEFWPTQPPRKFGLAALVRTSPPTEPSRLDPEVARHWLADFAARVELDRSRIGALQQGRVRVRRPRTIRATAPIQP